MPYQFEGNDDTEKSLAEFTGCTTEDGVLQQLKQQVIAHHLSYNVMHGTSSPTTIRVKAHIDGLKIQALIDGGSSNSFIQPRIAKFLNLPVEPASGFKVMVGNFDVMPVEGCIPSLEVSLQGYKVQIPEVYYMWRRRFGYWHHMAQATQDSHCGLQFLFYQIFT